ncbi:hypothetical protein N658DRAFT_497826 [Parathielavia hyrcaniae]|uniref:Uncharacterized protein n=1 Tax=Parathielavia hyrcaniae TaxID=113614 RepID=A0AAN6PXZ3_9PEZI|nr:hypothetical protein N658DRAFT_497826 [Parathielavia hyrcaniae]
MDSEKHEPEPDEEEQAFLRQPSEDGTTSSSDNQRGDASNLNARRRQTTKWMGHLRLLMEIAMAVTIISLVVFKPFFVARETLRRTPVPQFPRKIYTFRDNSRYLRDDMWFNQSLAFHTLHNWIELSSDSRGYVVIPDRSRYDLPEPYEVAIDRYHNGEGYMVTVFHQLHCLSYLAEHFQRGYNVNSNGGTGTRQQLTDEVAHHASHCFNYLRQGITCSADTTLEGKAAAGPGEGSEHECVDYEALLRWANDHAAMKWRTGLLPGESIL